MDNLMYTNAEEKLRFETMISELCSAFVNVLADEVDEEINRWLAFVITTLGVDRGTLFQISEDNSSGILTHTWAAKKSYALDKSSIAELREGVYVLPWSVEKMLRGEHIVFSSMDELPLDATADREFYQSHGTKSNVTIPLLVGGGLVGAIAFSSVQFETQWSDELIQRLQMVAHVFASALSRKIADIELKSAFVRYQTLFESANDAIFVMNEGKIVECNGHCVAMFNCQAKPTLSVTSRASLHRRYKPTAKIRLIRTIAWSSWPRMAFRSNSTGSAGAKTTRSSMPRSLSIASRRRARRCYLQLCEM